nr:adhesion G-protein coupled receptor D1-like [Cherax quadricarinatus]
MTKQRHTDSDEQTCSTDNRTQNNSTETQNMQRQQSQAYSITTDFHLGDIYTLSDVNGAANNSETVAGPFGFGYAISLNGSKDQCVSDKNFASNNSCMYDPAQCTQGFSISIWERSNFSLQEFMGASNYQTFPLKYLVSTGGDDEGHPGVALYHQGIFLVGLVSTGTMYWKEMVVGAVYNDTWTNIALRWDPVNGLEGMINDRRVFYRQYGVNCTRLPPLNPPEIMIGCHKDSNNTVYRDFNTADLDELAIWQKRLPDNNTVFFLGGFEEDAKNLNPAKLDRILDGVDLTDPQQQIQAISALVAMTDPHNIQPVNASVNASSGTGVSASQLESFSTTLGLVQRLADPSSVPKCININDAPKSLGLVAALSNLMDTSRKQEWEAYQAQTGQDPLYYCKVLEPYLMAVAEALSCNNGTTRMGVHITVEHAHLQLDKLSIDDLSSMDNGFTSPVYTQQSYLSESWGQPREKVQVTGDIFADRRCLQRPINIITMLYENTHNVLQVPLKVNVEILDTPAVIELDSRVLGVTLNADQVLQSSGEVNPKMPKCEPDPNMLSSSPVLVTLMHRHSQFTMRKPLFHSNSSTDIVTRYCVWWNPDVGEAGGWDPSGCRIWYTNPQYTKCACQQTGMYAVLSQTIQTMSIPTEPSWLQTLRYVFYGLSAACLLLFILVVALSGELKEQFHLMGVTLALVLLAGSVFMVLTDLNSVRDTRHMCTAVGTLLHFLYLCAGAYVAMIGHATFDCVTSGIIGGRLQAYGCVGVGLTLISVGCAYTFFLQDLGNDPRCFISWSNFPKLLFFSPQVAFCCVGLFCAIVIFFNLHTASLRNNPSITDYRTFSLGASLFAVYFSLTWSIGVVSYLHLDLQIDFYPYFQILNGLMGVVLLLCLGACSSRFRMVLAGKAKRRVNTFFFLAPV